MENPRSGAIATGRQPTPLSPESVQGIIAQTSSHLQDIEHTLMGILDRLQPMDNKKHTGGEAVTVPSGILNAANLMRNHASILCDLARQLDALI